MLPYKHIVYRHILCEPFYLCVPRTHPLAYQDKRAPENYPEISLTEFKDDLFTLVRRTSTLRAVIDRLFVKAGFKPKLLFESISMRTMQRLAANGQCCSIIPRYYAIEDDDVAYFTRAGILLGAVYCLCQKPLYQCRHGNIYPHGRRLLAGAPLYRILIILMS